MAISYSYDFGKQLNLTKVKSKLKMSSLDGDKNVLYIFVDPLFIMLFKNGRLRVVHKERNVESLRKSLIVMNPRLRDIIQNIAKASGIKVNVDSIISSGDVENGSEPLERQGLDGIGFYLFRELSIAAPEKVLGPYQRERISTQAGETLGRRLASAAKDRKGLEAKLIDVIENEGLGVPSLIPLDKAEKLRDEVQKPDAIYRVLQSTSYGLVPEGKAMCDLIRGLMRGAYCAYIGRENVNVVETRCWGLGDVYCEFRVYLLKS
jgi:predicted hydrocarbon binding protein